ncbi:unnamed protein product [Strongylus vulgaris]|uniref:Uncharacterized protein n=1 Tax=Strongylus vulgaris TaxID=40348 RepID=A0A3P7JAK2_STRVU|nr:unnamed protein product [Strongylus vulgaris]
MLLSNDRTPDILSTSPSGSNEEKIPANITKTALALRNQLAALPANNAIEFLANVRKTALALRNQLAALPANNAIEFLANVRKVAREIDIEANVVSEELAVIEESYPRILSTLQGFKRDLLHMREEVCMLRSRLKWVNRGRELLTSCREAMKDPQCDWSKLEENFCSACLHAQEIEELNDNSRITFIDGLNSLAPELKEFARKKAKELLDNLKYPFEDSIDIRAFMDEANTLAAILSFIYSVSEHLEQNTGYDEVCQVLLEPIGTRFAFHFYGDRKTNDIRKPQWYLSQTLNWIQVNLPFFETVQGKVIKEHVSSIH